MKLSLLVKNGFWATYGAISTRVLALLSNLVLARLLLPSDFGVIGIAYIFWALVNLFAQDTLGSFLIYKGLEDKRYINTTYTISLCIGLTLGCGLIVVSPLVAKFFGIPDLVGILAIFAFNLVLSFVQSIYTGVLVKRMQHRELANSNFIASVVRVFSTVGCALFGLSYWSFAIGDSAYWLTSYTLMHRHSRLDFRLQIHPQVRSEVLTYGLGATGNSLGYYLSANCDNFVVGKLLGASTLGYYSFAYQLTMVLPTMMSQAICQIWVSAFAQISEEQQQQELLVQVLEKTAFLAAPIHALFYLIIDKQVIALVFGDKWAPSAVVIPWLLIFAYSRLLNSLLGSMLSVKGRPEINAQVTLLIAPFAVCSFVIGAIYHGVIGVSIGVALVLGIVWTFYWWWLACRQLRWSLTQFLIPVVKPALIALMAVVISFIVPMSIKPFVFIFSYIILARFLAFDTFVELSKLIIKILKFQ